MSTADVTFYGCERVAGTARFPKVDFATLRAAVAGVVVNLIARLQHYRAMQRIARFSDHRLRDLGLERDWDGSVIRARR